MAVEPDGSAVLSGEKAGLHGIQGIGAGLFQGSWILLYMMRLFGLRTMKL